MKVTTGALVLLTSILVFNTRFAVADARALIRIFDDPDYEGEVTISIDGRRALAFVYQGGGREVDAGTLTIPTGAKELQFAGRITREHPRRGKFKSASSVTVPVLDLTPLTRTLRTSAPWPQRLTQFMKQMEAFEEKNAERIGYAQLGMDPGERASKAAIQTATKRLGYALPAEHVQVLEQFGAFQLGDSFTTPATGLQNALEQIVKLWESPRSSVENLPAKTKQLLESSVILFTTVGDGYGAVLFRPPTENTNAGQGTFYITQQDSLVDIRPLKNRNGSYKDYAQTLMWFLATEGLSAYTSAAEAVGVDHSAAAEQVYTLGVNPDGTNLRFSMYPEWDRFE